MPLTRTETAPEMPSSDSSGSGGKKAMDPIPYTSPFSGPEYQGGDGTFPLDTGPRMGHTGNLGGVETMEYVELISLSSACLGMGLLAIVLLVSGYYYQEKYLFWAAIFAATISLANSKYASGEMFRSSPATVL